MLRVDGTPEGGFDGFFTDFCVCLVLLSGFGRVCIPSWHNPCPAPLEQYITPGLAALQLAHLGVCHGITWDLRSPSLLQVPED